MCPEPNFSWQYRRLVEAYRLTPEADAWQLKRILERVDAGRGQSEAEKFKKGGIQA